MKLKDLLSIISGEYVIYRDDIFIPRSNYSDYNNNKVISVRSYEYKNPFSGSTGQDIKGHGIYISIE